MSAAAAVAVMIIHAGSGGMGSFAAKMMHQFFAWGVCTFAVPWFFFASGYFFAGHLDEPGWWRRALATRLKSLAIPYLFWCGLFICLSTALGALTDLYADRPILAGTSPSRILIDGFGLNLSEHPSLVPFWYIRALAIIVCLAPPLMWALRRWRWGVPMAILPLYVYCCGVNNCHAMPWFLFYSPFSLAGWFYFSIGALARMSRPAIDLQRINSIALWTAAMTAICAGRLAQYWSHPEIAGILWIAGIPPLLLGVWRLIPAAPWPAWLVASAFPVYAIHYFIVHFLEKTFLPLAHPAWWAYPARAAIIIAASFAIANLLRRSIPEARFIFGGR